jgi:transcription elongation factor GreA
VTDRITLTAPGRRHLEEELRRLGLRQIELRELLEDAHSDRTADDDERAAALALLDEHGRIEQRLAELKAILELAIDAPTGVIEAAAPGTVVTIRGDDGVDETYTLVNPAEASSANGRVSIQSPLGQALLGRRVGDRATVVAPSGSWEMEIVRIDAAV